MPNCHEALRVVKRVYIIAEARGYAHASNHNSLMVWSMSSYDAPLCTKAMLVIKTAVPAWTACTHSGRVVSSFELHIHAVVPLCTA